MTPIVITQGEPAGIGPDIILKLAVQNHDYPWVVVGDAVCLQARAEQLGLDVHFHCWNQSCSIESHQPGHVWVLPVDFPALVEPGALNPDNSHSVLKCLDKAIELCQQGYATALVTAPVHKGVINEAGVAFTGHTEYLAEKTDTKKVVMMLASDQLKVALATTHIPLSEVPKAITKEHLVEVFSMVHKALRERFGMVQPHIAVCGLNPHAGEGGYIGLEDKEIIEPAISEMLAKGGNISGPWPADSLFSPLRSEQFDAIIAMYHDQGLTPIKAASFGKAVNVTLGLPIIRTSVDHGTALSLAGTGKCSESSLKEAMDMAFFMSSKTVAVNG